MDKPICGDLEVKLLGEDGNAFFILGKVMKEMEAAGYSKQFIEEYRREATSGDYNHLLVTTMKYVNVK